MHRIDNATASTSLPTVAAVGPKPNSYWTAGNPSSGIPATILDEDAFNAVQEELMSFLTAASITPVKGTFNQVLAAVTALFGNAQSLSANGYIKFSGGLILQWGNGTFPNTGGSDSTFAVTFPEAFPNNVWAVVGAPERQLNSTSGGYPTWNAQGQTLTGFTAAADGLSTVTMNRTVPFTYIALGN